MPSEAEQALQAARRAKAVSEAVMPLVSKTLRDLQDQTLALADAMESGAKELREAARAAEADIEHAEQKERDKDG